MSKLLMKKWHGLKKRCLSKLPMEKWHGLWWRLPLCALVVLRALTLGTGSGPLVLLLILVGTLMLVACIMASPMSGWAANQSFGWLGNLFYPERTSKRIPPIYGPAESRRMAGHPAEALEAYEAILVEYPENGRCYLAMMDIAWQDMQDAGLANNFYRRARQTVKNEDCLAEMRQAYDDFAPYLKDKQEASPSRDAARPKRR